jgi:LAGLIDADG DNA endonuclease family
VETLFARAARGIALTSLQRELVIGSMLGDGYLMPTTAGYCFRVSHGPQQRRYVDWKFGILSAFVRTAPRASGRSYYFRTITHPEFSGLRRAFYGSTFQKVLPVELLYRELSPFGLAVWFMDDGAGDRKQLRINTQCFSQAENLVLVEFLQAKFGIAATLNKDKDRYRVRIGEGGIERFVGLVRRYVIPSMLYKLPP